MKTETKPYNPIAFFQSDEEIIRYLNDACMDEDPDMFIIALEHVARAKGIAQLGSDADLDLGKLFQALSGKGHADWHSVQRLIRALNMNIRIAA